MAEAQVTTEVKIQSPPQESEIVSYENTIKASSSNVDLETDLSGDIKDDIPMSESLSKGSLENVAISDDVDRKWTGEVDYSNYVIGKDGQICASDAVRDYIEHSYIHINNNIFRRGTNGKIPTECMVCQCSYDPDEPSSACGPDSGCINRELCIECTEDCPTGDKCQNRRFQKRKHSSVEIFKTQKKGLGLRAVKPMKRGEFLMEYVGEVLTENMFQDRVEKRKSSGQRHFYYMSLKKNEMIDAAEKGNVARFINHSCNPNCVLEKWVVKDQLRLGLFVVRDVDVGEECTFNYQYEIHGDKAQICHCGEAFCTGFIGTTKGDLSAVTGISESESDDELDPSKFQKARKRTEKVVVDKEEIRIILRDIYQSHDKPTKIRHRLSRLDKIEESHLLRHIIHIGLPILKWCLVNFVEANPAIIRKTLSVLGKLQLRTRAFLKRFGVDFRVKEIAETKTLEIDIITAASELLDKWNKLEEGYIIPKRLKNKQSKSKGGENDSTNGSLVSVVTSVANPSSEIESTKLEDYLSYDDSIPVAGRYSKMRVAVDDKASSSSSLSPTRDKERASRRVRSMSPTSHRSSSRRSSRSRSPPRRRTDRKDSRSRSRSRSRRHSRSPRKQRSRSRDHRNHDRSPTRRGRARSRSRDVELSLKSRSRRESLDFKSSYIPGDKQSVRERSKDRYTLKRRSQSPEDANRKRKRGSRSLSRSRMGIKSHTNISPIKETQESREKAEREENRKASPVSFVEAYQEPESPDYWTPASLEPPIPPQVEDEATENEMDPLNETNKSVENPKKMKAEVSAVVTKQMSKYKSSIQPHKFKKIAKALTEALLEKEVKAGRSLKDGLSEKAVTKAKEYVKSYLERKGYKRDEIKPEQKNKVKYSHDRHKSKIVD